MRGTQPPIALSTGNRRTDAKRPKLGVTVQQRDLVRSLVVRQNYSYPRAAKRAGVTEQQVERIMFAASSPRVNAGRHVLNVTTKNHLRCKELCATHGTMNGVVTALLALLDGKVTAV